MRKSKQRAGLLVLVETGAAWPAAFLTERPGAVRRVVAQEEGEMPEAFAARIGALAGRLFSPRVRLANAIVACNERTDPAASLARRSIGALLSAELGTVGTCVFTAAPHAGGRIRHALSTLALDLARSAAGSVTVHFGDERPTAETNDPGVARVA
jgi:hypothetical protein